MKKIVAMLTLCSFLICIFAGPAIADVNDGAMVPGVNLQDIDDDWAREDIEAVVAKGLIKGYEDNTYRPNQPVTCLEVIVMLIRAASLEDQVDNYSLNSDEVLLLSRIPSWGKAYVAVALEAGILSTADISIFEPQKGAMRYQVCLYMQNALKLCSLQDEDSAQENFGSFTDDALIPSQARNAVYLMNKYGVIDGYPDGSFGPTRVVKRNEMAKMLNNFDENCLRNTPETTQEEFTLNGTLANLYYNSAEDTMTVDVMDDTSNRWRFTLTPEGDADVYYEGSIMRLNSDLVRTVKTGGPSIVFLDEEQDVVWIKIYDKIEAGQTILAGTLEDIKFHDEDNSLDLNVMEDNGTEWAFDLERGSGIKVFYNSRYVMFNEDLDAIIPGGLITVVLDEDENPVLLRIYVPDNMVGYEILSGSLDEISFLSGNLNIELTDNEDDEWDFMIDENDDVDIYYDGKSMEFSSDLNKVQEGGDIKILLDEDEEPVWVRIYSD